MIIAINKLSIPNFLCFKHMIIAKIAPITRI